MKHVKLFEQFLNESNKAHNDVLNILKMAIKHHEEGNPYYDRTKLINIYNQLNNKDQQKAKKMYPEILGV